MTQSEFHQAFNELSNAFPMARVGDTVEATWFRKFQPYATFRVRAAFNLLAMEDRFPTMGAAFAMVKDIVSNRVTYVVPEFGFCYSATLGDGKVRCGCGECQPDAYKRHSERHHATYGRWPWERPEKGPLELLGEKLAENPGGIEGFREMTKRVTQANAM